MQKFMSFIIVFFMFFSMVSINVAAEGDGVTIILEADKPEVAQNGSFILNVYLKGYTDDMVLQMPGFTLVYDDEKLDSSNVEVLENNLLDVKVSSKRPEIKFGKMMPIVISAEKTLVGKIQFALVQNADVDEEIEFSLKGVNFLDEDNYVLSSESEVTQPVIRKPIVIGSAVTTGETVSLGTALADVEALLAENKVIISDEEDPLRTAERFYTNWVCDNWNSDKAGNYTFTAEIPEEELIRYSDIKPVTEVFATVTIEPITLADNMVAAVADFEIKQTYKDSDVITANAAIAHPEVAGLLPTEISISNNGLYKETASVTWAPAVTSVALDLSKKTEAYPENYVAIEGTVVPREDSNYVGTAKVTARIIVVPSVIANSVVKLSSAVQTVVPSVEVTFPAEYLTGNDVLEITIYDKAGNAVETVSKTITAASDKYELEFSKALEDMGFTAYKDFFIGGTLNGLKLGDSAEKVLYDEYTSKMLVGDLNGDGEIDMVDVGLLYQFYMELIFSFPIE